MQVLKTWKPKDSEELRTTTRLVAQCGSVHQERRILVERNSDLASKILKLSRTYQTLTERFGMIQREMKQVSEELSAAHREQARVNIVLATSTGT